MHGIIAHAKTKDECPKKLFADIESLCDYKLHLISQKYSFFPMKIEYLGHVIEDNKISPPSKVKAITRMRTTKECLKIKLIFRYGYFA